MENKEIKISTNAKDILEIEATLEQRILSEQVILNDISRNQTKYLVCYINSIPVGYLAYSNCIDNIDIISVAVKPEYRRKKIAKMLFEYLEATNSETLVYFLEVRKSNSPAIKLYTTLDYKNIYTRKDYYSNPKEDALIFTKNKLPL